MNKKRRVTEQQENYNYTQLSDEEIKGWVGDQVLLERNMNTISYKKQNRTYLKSAKNDKNPKKQNQTRYTFHMDELKPVSHFELLKKQIEYLQKDKVNQRFPTSFHQHDYFRYFIDKKRQFLKKSPYNKKLTSKQNINDLLIQGLIHQKQIKTNCLKVRPMTCCPKQDENQSNSGLAIHCKKIIQTPFKHFFVKKRNEKIKLRIDSTDQVQKRNKMVGEMQGKCIYKSINHTTSFYNV